MAHPEPEPSHTNDAQETDWRAREGERFLIVGIGASAGGLEAFERFLGRLPSDSGLAYVLVQHLSPEHESRLVDILSRTTSLPVRISRSELGRVSRFEPAGAGLLLVLDGLVGVEEPGRDQRPSSPSASSAGEASAAGR